MNQVYLVWLLHYVIRMFAIVPYLVAAHMSDEPLKPSDGLQIPHWPYAWHGNKLAFASNTLVLHLLYINLFALIYIKLHLFSCIYRS